LIGTLRKVLMEINDEQTKYFAALSRIPLLGAVNLMKLLQNFNSPQNIWEASDGIILKTEITPSVRESLCENRRKINPGLEMSSITGQSIKLITIFDQIYPSLLKEIYDPPITLFIKGDDSVLKNRFFSVVGTRKETPYGERAAQYFTGELIRKGFTIVSGMARGIDALVHREAIRKDGKTVAVWGSGLDVAYPPENKRLSEEIIDHGCIISEFPLGTPPLKQNFLIRNRIISGLSQGLLVVEAAEKSGTINIANQALEQNREVFAVPGSIFNPLARGTLLLIKNGAKPCQNINDILEELQTDNPQQNFEEEIQKFSEEEKSILVLLTKSDMLNTDEIVLQTKIPIKKVNELLTKLEMDGIIERLKGLCYALKKS
jgi:DNA processing protein